MSIDLLAHWDFFAEVIATITGIICVFLQTMEKIIAWFFGIISVSLLAIIFLTNNLLSDFILHIIFLILNIYGWWTWSRYREQSSHDYRVLRLGQKQWVVVMAVIILITPLWGYMMLRFFNADFAYVDAFTTVGSLVAQYLLAKKFLENWLLWIVVDIVAITVYMMKGLYVVAFLFLVYLTLCIFGYYNWKSRDRNNQSRPIIHLLD